MGSPTDPRQAIMASHHSHLTPDLPPIIEVPDLPGAQHPSRSARDDSDAEPVTSSPHASGAHQEVDGRHKHAGEGSGG
ncbi:hypothetical protein BLA24_06645 [Streptomyces cinnamoneus]|uniref:Uncharacterized protein n=1 Tax=Streptomyces cinnamoneus TaxID=53446 RepID=A0A2G1XMJ6_STRCJ|nr:hypothetical protein BLA24_06645 [Streptomyces cinnamoneus]PPT15990.1 hypothetical protein CYQ11_26795 [Streptomyces cinnamoneus]